MSAIEKFIERVNTASKANSKEVRLQLAEAQAIVTELAVLGSRNASLADQLIETQQDLIEAQRKSTRTATTSESISVEMDGGGF